MSAISLTPKQILAATAIAMGESHKQAAKAAKVTQGTVSDWMQNPEFKAMINEIQFGIMNEARDRFRGLALASITTLETILASAKSEKMKFEAAKYILDTIDLAPAQAAFWFVGPTTAEEIEKQEHQKAMRNRLSAFGEEMY